MNPVQRAALKAKIEQTILPPKPKPAPAPPSPPKTAKIDPQPTKPKKKKSKYYEHSRLPDGAAFQVRYNEEKQEWVGELRLAVLDCPNPTCDLGFIHVFTERSSGVFRLLMKLDRLYREHLAKESPNAL